jgi:hypothetical protein
MKSSGPPNMNLKTNPMIEKTSPITAAIRKKGRATANRTIEPKTVTATIMNRKRSRNSPIILAPSASTLDAIKINL